MKKDALVCHYQSLFPKSTPCMMHSTFVRKLKRKSNPQIFFTSPINVLYLFLNPILWSFLTYQGFYPPLLSLFKGPSDPPFLLTTRATIWADWHLLHFLFSFLFLLFSLSFWQHFLYCLRVSWELPLVQNQEGEMVYAAAGSWIPLGCARYQTEVRSLRVCMTQEM